MRRWSLRLTARQRHLKFRNYFIPRPVCYYFMFDGSHACSVQSLLVSLESGTSITCVYVRVYTYDVLVNDAGQSSAQSQTNFQLRLRCACEAAMALRCCDRGMNTVHFCCDEPAMKYCRSQSERAAIYVYRHSYSEPLLHNHKY
jgi:hypothetical protein